MGLNSLQQIRGSSIVQEEQTLAKAPEWRRAELVRPSRPLVDPIRQLRTHVMDREIGIRVVSDI